MPKSALRRSGDDRGLSAAEANEVGRIEGAQRGFPQRTESWDHMTGTQINKLDGSDKVPSSIVSGEGAVALIESVGPSTKTKADLRCNCEVRHQRSSTEKVSAPPTRSDGVCLSCGVLR